MSYKNLSMRQLTFVYNLMADEKITKFADKEKGIKRVEKIAEKVFGDKAAFLLAKVDQDSSFRELTLAFKAPEITQEAKELASAFLATKESASEFFEKTLTDAYLANSEEVPEIQKVEQTQEVQEIEQPQVVEKSVTEKPAKKKRAMRFIFVPDKIVRTPKNPQTLLYQCVALLKKGATFKEVEDLMIAFDIQRGKPHKSITQRAYATIRDMHYILGFGIRCDFETGIIQIYSN